MRIFGINIGKGPERRIQSATPAAVDFSDINAANIDAAILSALVISDAKTKEAMLKYISEVLHCQDNAVQTAGTIFDAATDAGNKPGAKVPDMYQFETDPS